MNSQSKDEHLVSKSTKLFTVWQSNFATKSTLPVHLLKFRPFKLGNTQHVFVTKQFAKTMIKRFGFEAHTGFDRIFFCFRKTIKCTVCHQRGYGLVKIDDQAEENLFAKRCVWFELVLGIASCFKP